MDEIKRLNRDGPSAVLLERHSQVKKLLIATQCGNEKLTSEQASKLSVALVQLKKIEADTERRMANHTNNNKGATKANNILSNQIDDVYQVLVEIQNSIGGNK